MGAIGISRLAEATGVKVPTIRYYEANGLLPAPRRTEGGQRRYDADAVRRLRFIRHPRDLGFEVADIRQLLTLTEHPTLSCEAATQIAQHHLEQVENKLHQLNGIRRELERMVAACSGGRVADCRILDAIAGKPSLAANTAQSSPRPGRTARRSRTV